jgi:hypothetical protein
MSKKRKTLWIVATVAANYALDKHYIGIIHPRTRVCIPFTPTGDITFAANMTTIFDPDSIYGKWRKSYYTIIKP